MIGNDWHVDSDDLVAYAAGQSGPAGLASVEAHLGRCGECRSALTALVRSARTDDAADPVWCAIADRVDAGNRWLQRWPRLATVSLASPPLALSTALVAAALVVLVVLARLGSPRFATTTLVSLGPIAPLVSARLAYGRGVDPAGLMAAAAPVAAGRVAAMRALVGTLLACLVGLAVMPLTTLAAGDLLAWLLPAVAGTATAVAIGTYIDATVPVALMVAGWLAVVGVWLAGVPQNIRGVTTDGLWSAATPVQVSLLGVALAAGAVSLLRGDADPAWRSAS